MHLPARLMGRAASGVLRLAVAATALLTVSGAHRPPPLISPVLWAWERAEDLRFVDPGVTIAILVGTIRLTPTGVQAQPRLQPALLRPAQPVIGVVHVDTEGHPVWTPAMREKTAALTLALLKNPRFTAVQIDFEVKASDRVVLLDLLADVRAGLAGRKLSMTALASWCDTETWIDAAPVDEIVPMLFRMGPA